MLEDNLYLSIDTFVNKKNAIGNGLRLGYCLFSAVFVISYFNSNSILNMPIEKIFRFILKKDNAFETEEIIEYTKKLMKYINLDSTISSKILLKLLKNIEFNKGKNNGSFVEIESNFNENDLFKCEKNQDFKVKSIISEYKMRYIVLGFLYDVVWSKIINEVYFNYTDIKIPSNLFIQVKYSEYSYLYKNVVRPIDKFEIFKKDLICFFKYNVFDVDIKQNGFDIEIKLINE